jgi:hypothetical protein
MLLKFLEEVVGYVKAGFNSFVHAFECFFVVFFFSVAESKVVPCGTEVFCQLESFFADFDANLML